jgi:uncharacterized RmlC-like cupin family protein
MQNQTFATILDGRDDANAAGSPLCQLAIYMAPGHVSTPHVHDRVHVYVRVEECGPQGALTLWGDQLKNEEWTFPGQTLWIPPGVPHVAVYPRFGPSDDDITLVACETRTTSDPQDDVQPLPALWPVVVQRLEDVGLLDRVELPSDARTVSGTEE